MSKKKLHQKQPLSDQQRKRAGVLLPVFSIRTTQNLGIGELHDLIPFIDFMVDQDLSVLQILPIYETAPTETCPYQALSSFARDPIYLSLQDWPDIQKSPEARRFFADATIKRDLQALQSSHRVCYEQVRCLKNRLLRYAFKYFKKYEWAIQSERAIAFQVFMKQKSVWLKDYALFRLLKQRCNWAHWKEWPEALKSRNKTALEKLAQAESDELLFIQYLQWALWTQWQNVQRHAKKQNVLIMGDIPFLISHDSADVWSEAATFSDELTVGVPPDAFSATGQDWGLPLFHWQEMLKNDFRWWRMRISEMKDTVDLIRLDHLVGYFRVWVIPKETASYFEPGDESEQVARGSLLLKIILQELDETIPIAEDLGTIPESVRQVLKHLHIAGMKVMRWEKTGEQFVDPRDFPLISLATTGTHDTSSLQSWWREISVSERCYFLKMLQVPECLAEDSVLSEALHLAILDRILAAGSQWVILPIQDILGEDAQINLPATVGTHNWRYRLPIFLHKLRQSSSPYKKRLASLKNSIDRRKRS